IKPFLGSALLSQLTVPGVREFQDKLRKNGRSQAMTRKVLGSLGSLLSDAQERGLATRNPVKDMRSRRRRGKERQADKRQKGKLKIGVDIPTREEIKAIVAAVRGRWRPLLITAIFSGMRSSELRGLRWSDVDLDKAEIAVRQR
ncbi:MAG: site-specific integrase, partial [Mesorhizobium sp.]